MRCAYPWRNTLHPIMWKLSYIYCYYVVAAWLHNAAIVSAQEVYRARWNEVMHLDVTLVDWVKLLMVRDFKYHVLAKGAGRMLTLSSMLRYRASVETTRSPGRTAWRLSLLCWPASLSTSHTIW